MTSHAEGGVMDDRTLLELAAMAAVVETLWDETLSRLYIIDGEHVQGEFRPLTDDGDRYRLARALGISLDFTECYAWKRLTNGDLIQEFWGGDTGVDEAHAITRVAAAIGQEMREKVERTTPDGWQIVPKEPTPEMLNAGERESDNEEGTYETVFRAMLAAAPNPKGAKE